MTLTSAAVRVPFEDDPFIYPLKFMFMILDNQYLLLVFESLMSIKVSGGYTEKPSNHNDSCNVSIDIEV